MSSEDIQNMEHNTIDYADLNHEQQQAADHILEGHNVFVTGSAGTGKTFLLRYVIQEMLKQYSGKDGGVEGEGEARIAVTAPTGIAAVNIGGQTIHSFAGIGIGSGNKEKLLSKVMKNKSTVDRWLNCQILIIDEISMLDQELFELLDDIARRIRENDAPFGGLQVIVVGDFMQLPPVKNEGAATFCFESPLWRAAGFHKRAGIIHLETVVRQSDINFVQYLNEVRLGIFSVAFQKELSKCLTSIKPKPTTGIIPTKLYAINKQVDAENQMRLAELSEVTMILTAEDKWKIPPSKTAVGQYIVDNMENVIPTTIELKIGAQVMLLRNRSRGTYGGTIKLTGPTLVNGSRGKVIAFTESVLRSGMMLPTVLFDNGMITTIGPVDYESKGPKGDGVLIRQQVPLKLAWAATIHKSQGCTLTCAELMLDRAFDYGQAYVALSRVKNLEGLWLSRAIDRRVVKAHPKVLAFYGYQV